MRRTGVWWAAALVVASNLGAWGFAALNRSGEPEAVLELTERELRLPARQAENTALTLSVVFIGGRDGGTGQPREAGWFNRAKLQSIGFDCSRPVAQEHAAHYRSRPPRMTYAAMEYQGESWRGTMAQHASDSPLPPVQGVAPERPAAAGGPGIASGDPAGTTKRRGQDNLLPSRLVAIDVDNDPVALRTRHPDRRRVAVMEATAALWFVENSGQPPFLLGLVTAVLPGEINVPREWLTLLQGLQTDRRIDPGLRPLDEPRFRVTVRWGRNLEPWIANVQPMPMLPATPPHR